MTAVNRNKLKVVGLLISFLAIFSAFLNLIGAFSYPDRKVLVETIRMKGRIAIDQPGFSDVLKAFPPPDGVSVEMIKGMAPLTSMKSGGVCTPTGPLIYFGDGWQTGRIVTYDEFVVWSSKSGYPWVSLMFGAVGWVVVAIGVIADLRERPVTGSGRANSMKDKLEVT